jgi:hypothetical protein
MATPETPITWIDPPTLTLLNERALATVKYSFGMIETTPTTPVADL